MKAVVNYVVYIRGGSGDEPKTKTVDSKHVAYLKIIGIF